MESGNRAIAQFEKGNEFDIVISDITMRDGDGLSLYKYVRSVDPKIPFVIITGHLSKSLPSDDPRVTILEKPVEWKTFVELIASAMADSGHP